MTKRANTIGLLAGIGLMLATAPSTVRAETLVKDLTHWEGQRINKVHGLGLVYGLAGTGDGKAGMTAINMLAKLQQNFGQPPSSIKDLSAKNVAVVMVEVTLPANGVRSGHRADARIASFGGAAKSLKGGMLLRTPLVCDPAAGREGVWGFASGKVELPDPTAPNRGVVRRGALFEQAFVPEFVTPEGKARLIIDKPDGWAKVQAIAGVINDDNGVDGLPASVAVARDTQTIEITVPAAERANPAVFLAQIEDLPVFLPPREKVVVINRRTKTIFASPDMEIAPGSWVQHGNINIEVKAPGSDQAQAKGSKGAPVVASAPKGAKLSDLLAALEQLRVPAADVIDILEAFNKEGRLNGKIRYAE